MKLTVLAFVCTLVTCAGLAGFDSAQQKNEKKESSKVKPRFTISKETTYLLGPVGPDGYIDYVQALNDLCSKGVTAQNNACIPLVRALGPIIEGSKLPEEFYKRLGIAEIPEKGDYLVSWEQFFKKELEGDASRQKNDSLFERTHTRAWSATEFPKVAEWIKLNDGAAKCTLKASQCSRYYVPLVLPKNAKTEGRGLEAVGLPLAMPCRALCNLLTARTMLHIGEHQFDEALQELVACHRLARLIGQGGSLTEWLVATAMDQIAAQSDLAWLADDRVSSELLMRFQKEINALLTFPSHIEMVDKFERLAALDALFSIERHGMHRLQELGGAVPDWTTRVDDFLFYRHLPWDTALKEHNDWFNKYIGTLKIQDREDREEELRHFKDEISQIRGLVFKDNRDKYNEKWKKLEGRAQLLAEFYRVLLWPAFVKVQVAAEKRLQVERNLHVAIALARYQRDHHKYPESLNELTPKYLLDIPQDVFSSKDLFYRRTEDGYLLYSVGVNERDDGGRTRDDDPPGDDIVVRMPRPALKPDHK